MGNKLKREVRAMQKREGISYTEAFRRMEAQRMAQRASFFETSNPITPAAVLEVSKVDHASRVVEVKVRR